MLRSVSRVSSPHPAKSTVNSPSGHVTQAASWQDSALPRLLMPLLAGFLFVFTSLNQPHAAELGAHEFIIPANDGYGTSECLAQQSACGRVIADAWCEAHGHAHAIGYSRFEDVTAAISVAARPSDIPGDAIIVSCGE